MPMKDMALTPEEAKDSDYCGCCPSSDSDDKGPKYPWGLEISLRSESLKKLGMGLMPVGTGLVITARAKVTGNSQREREGSDPVIDMDIQITALDLSPVQADRMAKSAKALYPDAAD